MIIKLSSIFKKSILSLSLISIFSCNTTNISKFDIPQKNIKIQGIVSFPEKFRIKAEFSDIIESTTVSIIYPKNHPENPYKTLSTGLTDSSGNFLIELPEDFVPESGDLFLLQATKRLGGEGHRMLSLQTYIQFTKGYFESITSPVIRINNKTTALTIIDERNDELNPENTISTMTVSGSVTTPNSIGNITAQNILDVADLVDDSLEENFDPFFFIRYEDGNYFLDRNYQPTNYQKDQLLQSGSCTSCDLTDINILNIKFNNLNLSGTNLSGLNFAEKTLTNLNLEDANLSNTNLSFKDLTTNILLGINFSSANLEGANLSGLTISNNTNNANLSEVYLKSANLIQTTIKYADLNHAFLMESDLTEADLSYSDLTNADLTNANITDTVFTGADLSGATWIDGTTVCAQNSIGSCD